MNKTVFENNYCFWLTQLVKCFSNMWGLLQQNESISRDWILDLVNMTYINGTFDCRRHLEDSKFESN